MTIKTDIFNKTQLKSGVLEIRPGDTVKVHQKIKEKDKERIQVFEGLVIAAKHGKGVNGTITVRKVSFGVGVERIFPIHSPRIEKIEIIKKSKVRRSKLYYLREAKGEKAKLKRKEFAIAIAEEEKPVVEETPQIEQAPASETPEQK
jgi:large subunit ribosomal protein L19